MTKWHYTIGARFKSIAQDGVIKPATAFVSPGERPIVWFSTRPDWEPTANKAVLTVDGTVREMSREQTAAIGGGLVRIGVRPEAAPYDWQALKELSGMSSKIAQNLYRAAIEEGSRPGEWWGSFDPVPRSEWIAVEAYRDGAWVELERAV